MPVQAPITVTVSYDLDPHTKQPVVTVNPSVIQASPGQAIRFRRAGGMAGRMRVTFKDKDLFDGGNPQFAATGAFHEGDGDVQIKTLPGQTTFLCELLDPHGNRIAQSLKNAGGAVEPVKSAKTAKTAKN
jgi:hypothetical protein